MITAQTVFEDFCQQIIVDKRDPRNDEHWRSISEKLLHQIGHYRFDVNPRECILSSLTSQREFGKLVRTLEDVENAYYCLSLYALNLCREPHRPEYSLIKTYTGYYSANILSVMNGEDTYLLKSMGYAIPHDCINEDEFIFKPTVATDVRKIAFELFLSQVYCRKMRSLCTESRKYEVQVIISMLQNDVVYVRKNVAQQLCENIKQGVGRGSSHYQHPTVEKHIQTSQLPPTSEVDDDDLYGNPTPKQCENPLFDDDNSNSIRNVEVYDDHAFDRFSPHLGDLELVNPKQSMKHSMMPIKDRLANAQQQTALNDANPGNIYESDFHINVKRSDYSREPTAPQSRERCHLPDVQHNECTHKTNVNRHALEGLQGGLRISSSVFYTNASDAEKRTLASKQENEGAESDRYIAGKTDSHHSIGSNYTGTGSNRDPSVAGYPTNSNKKPATKIPTIYQ